MDNTETTTRGALQAQQDAVIAQINSEPSVADVMAALQQMQPYLPGPVSGPVYQTHFSLGANA